MKIVLQGEHPITNNKFFSGIHHTKRTARKNDAKWVLLAAIPPDAEMIEGKVHITITSFFDAHPIDADNVCVKYYIDGLKGRIIPNDDIRYVMAVTSIVCIDKDNPRVEIEVKQVPGT